MKLNYIDNQAWQKEKRTVCGVMSGTSLDGIDISLVDFYYQNKKLQMDNKLNYFEPYSEEVKIFFKNIINKTSNIEEITDANYLVSKLYALAINKMFKLYNISADDIDLIGMHGQTLWHSPKVRKCAGVDISSTFQAGSVSALMAQTGINVIGDFRAADIAMFGQGAPLVPIFDYEFLKNDVKDVIALNIGGIANITYIPKHSQLENIVAFDTGPGNVLIDLAVNEYFDLDYDSDGFIARSGSIIPELLEELKKTSYIYKRPPKSTGRELFNQEFISYHIEKFGKQIFESKDIIRTLTEFTAFAIAENIKMFANLHSQVIISGGGAKNKFLIERIHENLNNTEIIKSDGLGISSDFKESIAFAYLAYRSLSGLISNPINITGAKKELILGTLSIAL
jgi:anhydro-N-acetylmuramic acid kinase